MSETLHPHRVDLEIFAAGDPSDIVAAHLTDCEPCAAYVRELEVGAADFARNDADAFVEMLRTNATANANANANANATANANAVKVDSQRKVARGSVLFLRATRVVMPVIALAAGIFLLARWAPSREIVSANSSSSSELQRFKGGLQVAVVRERGGTQDRLSADVGVRPNDRARVEVSIDHPQPIAAGVLENDGTWTVLIAPAMLEGGTHYSEQAVRFDSRPTNGWVVVGEPTAVDRARTTRNLEGVVAIPLHAEAP